MKKLLAFGILFCLLVGSVSASLYTWKIESPEQIISQQPIWSGTFQTESGKNIDISLLEISEDSLTKRYGYINDGANEFLYLAFLNHDTSQEKYLWGCLDGAGFSQKFINFFKIIFGGEPFSITKGEEAEFEKEGKVIENTPGTGAYMSRQCKSSCWVEFTNKKFESERYNQCSDECTLKFKCGEVSKCNTLLSDGSCGINLIKIENRYDKTSPFESLIINLNPSSGKIIEKGSSYNGKNIVSY